MCIAVHVTTPFPVLQALGKTITVASKHCGAKCSQFTSIMHACIVGITLTFELQQPLSKTSQKFVSSDKVLTHYQMNCFSVEVTFSLYMN